MKIAAGIIVLIFYKKLKPLRKDRKRDNTMKNKDHLQMCGIGEKEDEYD